MTLKVYTDLIQGEQEWLAARCGLLTASVIGTLISKSTPDVLTVKCPKCAAHPNEPCMSIARKIPVPIKTVHDERSAVVASMPKTYTVSETDTARGLINTLAAERITGHVEYVHPTFDMQRGTDDEPYARDAYAEQENVTVEEVGFMVREEPGYKLGYSPDGLVGDDGLIEIKSRKPKEQLRVHLDRRVPSFNMAQLQTGLFVTGRRWIDYISYAQGWPLYIERIRPSDEWFNAIEQTATRFEIDVTNIVNNYTTATKGLPMTERREDEMEFTF